MRENNRWQKIVWYSFTLALAFVVLFFSPRILTGLQFILNSPAFPIWKPSSSTRPYSIGILNSVLFTFFRVFFGTLIGFSVGTLLGITFSYFSYIGARLHKLLLFFAPVAPLVWLPFALSVLGIGELTTLLLVSSGSVFVSGVVVYYLAQNTNRAYTDVARAFGATRWQCTRYVVVPSMIPMLLLLLRINFFAGWMAVLSAEMAGVEQGLGSMLILGRSLGNIAVITFAASLIILIAVALDRSLSVIAFYLIRRRFGATVRAKG
jgi:NitT/TauT family transport system permease protein